MARTGKLATALTLGLAATAIAVPAVTAATAGWKDIRQKDLAVTSGSIESHPADRRNLRTSSPQVRAVVRDAGRYASAARLSFRYLGPTATTIPLGSGEVRRQIGLKLRAQDPCNLLYVMWRQHPTASIDISVKRNPGQDESDECGNGGYSPIANIPLRRDRRAADAPRALEVRTQRSRSGSLAVQVYADGVRVFAGAVDRALAAGLDGPAGLRSDNGRYVMRLSTR
jgi:hypothetical protein